MRHVTRLALAALILVPASLPAHAGDDDDKEDRVRLLIECDAATAERVKTALAGLPLQISELKRTEATPGPEVRPPPTDYPGLPSAAEVMTKFYAALESAPRAELGSFFSIEKMSVGDRRATVTFLTDDVKAVEWARRALAADSYFRGRAKNPAHVVEMGSVARQRGHLKAQFTMRFKTEGDARLGARRNRAGDGISLAVMRQLADQAGLSAMRTSSERRNVYRGAGVVEVTQEYVYEETRLERLIKLLHAIDQRKDLTVVEVRWQLADDKENAQPPHTKVRRPSIKVGFWTTIER